ncbi:uncharacterized protein LOC121857185 isoform X1 [Homarus americanus]|uniref:uncharacterized protein LOC121857185 isoform X1 n=2 Tax=Homarus americanus TaxID=6706 RepID=UPI001C486C17|nr:uncharacterized protein LOC121857185 isoform X1 [Homarus americanus]
MVGCGRRTALVTLGAVLCLQGATAEVPNGFLQPLGEQHSRRAAVLGQKQQDSPSYMYNSRRDMVLFHEDLMHGTRQQKTSTVTPESEDVEEAQETGDNVPISRSPRFLFNSLFNQFQKNKKKEEEEEEEEKDNADKEFSRLSHSHQGGYPYYPLSPVFVPFHHQPVVQPIILGLNSQPLHQQLYPKPHQYPMTVTNPEPQTIVVTQQAPVVLTHTVTHTRAAMMQTQGSDGLLLNILASKLHDLESGSNNYSSWDLNPFKKFHQNTSLGNSGHLVQVIEPDPVLPYQHMTTQIVIQQQTDTERPSSGYLVFESPANFIQNGIKRVHNNIRAIGDGISNQIGRGVENFRNIINRNTNTARTLIPLYQPVEEQLLKRSSPSAQQLLVDNPTIVSQRAADRNIWSVGGKRRRSRWRTEATVKGFGQPLGDFYTAFLSDQQHSGCTHC